MEKKNQTGTPKPWRASYDGAGTWTIGDANGNAVALAIQPCGEENAKLIAAAPEMYDALHVAVGALAVTVGTENKTFQMVAAAIAKAYGKQ